MKQTISYLIPIFFITNIFSLQKITTDFRVAMIADDVKGLKLEKVNITSTKNDPLSF